MHTYPPVAFPALPPTSNTLSSHERSALVRSSRKLYKVLGDVPRVLEDDISRVSYSSLLSDFSLTFHSSPSIFGSHQHSHPHHRIHVAQTQTHASSPTPQALQRHHRWPRLPHLVEEPCVPPPPNALWFGAFRRPLYRVQRPPGRTV